MGDTRDSPPMLLTHTGAGSTSPAWGGPEDSFTTRFSRRVLFLVLLLLAVLKVKGFAEVLLPVRQGAGGLRGEMVTCEEKPCHSVSPKGMDRTEENNTPQTARRSSPSCSHNTQKL